ncbi:hypothetical protein FOZ62_027928 [Perkinsus olseni]|uniref:SWIM-type domain-containing protein n=1 Tax=Perkinsus olseni TaxID=32597 RepID=A0A7J6RK58_PEROL|nr:hypothetical protein FOZ62_027928 [Perkinsus olseni]
MGLPVEYYPSYTGDLKSIWEKYREEGRLSQRDVDWLDLRSCDPGYPSVKGNIRNLLTSLTKRKEAGMRLDNFLTSIKHLRIDHHSRKDVSLIVDAILRHDSGDDLPGDLSLRQLTNICVTTNDPLVKVDPTSGELSRLAILFTSPLMLANYVQGEQAAIDCTFNLLAGKVTVLTLATLTAGGSSKPAALALVKSENTADIVAALGQLHDLLSHLELSIPKIKRIVQDGSTALNSAIHQIYPTSVADSVTSCYFHFMQLAKSKKPSGMAVATWLEFKSDLRTVALAHTIHEFCTLLALLRAKWVDRQDADILDLFESLDDGGWLDISHFRSRWAACFTGATSGRTSNSLETYHRILKSAFLQGRTMRTLSQFAAALDDEGFRKASIHNKEKIPGRLVDDEDRRHAFKYRGTFAALPRTVAGPASSECPREDCSGHCTRVSHYLAPDETVYLFIDSDSPSGTLPTTLPEAEEFVSHDFAVTKRVTCAYDHFDDAKRALRNLHLVSFKTSSRVDRLPQAGGPHCTCLEYARHSKCDHVVLLSKYLATDDADAWDKIEARIGRAAARGPSGVSNELPVDARYGVRRPARSSRGAARPTEQSIDQLLREYQWPSHEMPTDEQLGTLHSKELAGCCGGLDDHSLAVYCSSRRCARSGWWHADCATSWANARSLEPPNLEDESIPWHCARCTSRRGRKRKRDLPIT